MELSIDAIRQFFENLYPAVYRYPKKVDGGIDGRLVSIYDRNSYLSEQYKSVASKLLLSPEFRDSTVFLFTSSQAGEGKTTTLANIAICLAKVFHKKTLFIDTDLRLPSSHELFGKKRSPGLSDVILESCSFEEAQVSFLEENLFYLSAGTAVDQPSEILNTQKFVNFVEKIKKDFDMVLFDAPPILKVADLVALGGVADSVVFVVRARQTPARLLEESLAVLKGTPAEPTATILVGASSTPDLYSYLTNDLYRQNYGDAYSYSEQSETSK